MYKRCVATIRAQGSCNTHYLILVFRHNTQALIKELLNTLMTQIKEKTVNENFKELYYSLKGFLEECSQLSNYLS